MAHSLLPMFFIKKKIDHGPLKAATRQFSRLPIIKDSKSSKLLAYRASWPGLIVRLSLAVNYVNSIDTD